MKLPAPKNKCSKDISLTSDVPIFATSIGEIRKTSGDKTNREEENNMMAARWKVFQFSKPIEEKAQKQVVSCKKCFAKLVLLGEPKPKRKFTFVKRKRSLSE